MHAAMRSFSSAAADVAVASTPAQTARAQDAPPVAAQPVRQPDMVEAQAAILAAHSAMQVNTVSVRSAQAMYAESMNLLSSGTTS